MNSKIQKHIYFFPERTVFVCFFQGGEGEVIPAKLDKGWGGDSCTAVLVQLCKLC